ncbi:GntR family transcriptional regulator [Microlunatus flavus]|uniref:DNA-binding transcriptional regulator, GntR family n=1 Tax=Microlunatus flavus TaxID=1036181 RepID=A0A1H9JJ73_9ACTN|nr:GntR family transcriptional regulator [Microlunatus flavus]SEQ86886.1 DNA-binding transcriptional regulator, GntR family [Microlunatus flavus]
MTGSSQTVQLYERLRTAVLSLDLLPGARVSERGIEGAYGASRTPTRAALVRLEAEGLVRREGRGWIVSPIDLDELRALGEFREAVEAAGVRLAVRLATDLDIAALRALVDASEAAVDEDEGVKTGSDFHLHLVQLSGNVFLVDAVQGSLTRLARTRWLQVRTAEARRVARSEHREIVDAVAARDAEQASLLLQGHIRDTNTRLLDLLADQSRTYRLNGLAVVGSR